MTSPPDQAAELRESPLRERGAERAVRGLRCIAVGGGKGGVGKTMISVGLASCLARRDRRVLLVDADLGLANADIQLGVDPTYTLQDVLYGDCPFDKAVTPVETGLDLLPSSSGAREMVDLGGARRDMLVGDLVRFAGGYDYLVIDTAAGIGSSVLSFLGAAPRVLLVVTNEPTSIMDAYSLVKILLADKTAPSIMLVANMVRSLDEGKRLAEGFNRTAGRFLGTEFPVAGIVLHDDAVGNAIRRRMPVPRFAPESAPAKCLEELARFVAADASGAHARVRGVSFFDRILDLAHPLEAKGDTRK